MTILLFGYPLTGRCPSRTAVDRAILEGGGDAMVNVTTDSKQLVLGPVTFVKTVVKGKAVKSK